VSERERSGERKKRSKGQNSSRVERARIPESHRPMHLYPARLSSALPGSVAHQSSLLLSLFRVLFCAPRLISGSSSSSVSSLPFSPASRNRSMDLRTSKRRRNRRRKRGRKKKRKKKKKKKKHVLTEGDACLSCASFPHSSLLSTELHATEKDQVHSAEIYFRFSIRIDDKDVTLLECYSRM